VRESEAGPAPTGLARGLSPAAQGRPGPQSRLGPLILARAARQIARRGIAPEGDFLAFPDFLSMRAAPGGSAWPPTRPDDIADTDL